MGPSAGGAGSVAVSAAFEPVTSDEATLGNVTGPVINNGPGQPSTLLVTGGIAALIVLTAVILYMMRK